jgi:AcrR family transcriptional regulator
MASARTTRRKRSSPGSVHERAADWTNPRVVQILDAAARCFAKSGFAATTTQEIADEAGMTKSMIHYYFDNKQALIGELQAFVYDRYLHKVDARLAMLGTGAEGRAYEALKEAYEIVRDRSFLRLQLELLAEAGRDPDIMQRLAVLEKRSRDVVGTGLRSVLGARVEALPISADALAALISAVLHGLRVFDYVEGEGAPSAEAYDIFIGLLLLGLKQMSPAAGRDEG